MSNQNIIRQLDENLSELMHAAFPEARSDLSKDLIDAAVSAVKAAPNLGQLDVRGSMALPGSVARYETITFEDQAVLVLEALDQPFIAIAARTLLLDIKNPTYRAFITRPVGKTELAIVSNLRGTDGNTGNHGADGQGDVNRQGMPGRAGGDGTAGWGGSTKETPPVFLFVQEIKFGLEGQEGRQFMYLYFQGIQGGTGGNGGPGGNGGDGGNGKAGASALLGCLEGPGRGGDGGSAGRGGAGGCGGTGGYGGSLYMFGPIRDMFAFATANIEPGQPGKSGNPGKVGRAGIKGRGGNASGFCGEGSDGNNGQVPSPPNYGEGTKGLFGGRGQRQNIVRDNSDLFAE